MSAPTQRGPREISAKAPISRGATQRAHYTTITDRGLDWDSVPMRLFQKAKRLGTWDPQAIDFSRELSDWAAFDGTEKDFLPMKTSSSS